MFKTTRRTIPALCIIAVLVIGLGIYLAPSHREIALMQMDDFHFNTALKRYMALHSEGDSSINVVAPLVNLNVYYGNIDKAIELLSAYIADNPRSIEGRKKLAELYKSSERYYHYCDVLEELQKLQPSAATLRALADTYAFLGRDRDELNALARLVNTDGYQPQESDYYKLASLYRIDHQPDEALHVLRGYIEDKKYRVSVELVYLAMELLLDSQREERALSIGQNYLNKQPQEDDAIVMSSMFEAHGQFEPAYSILEPFLANAEHSTDLEQQQVDVLLAQKKDEVVYTMLADQRTKDGALPPSLAVTLTDLAVGRTDFVMIETLIRSQDIEKLPEDVLLRYADISFQLKRPDLAQLMLTKLTPAYMREAPILQVVLNVAADDSAKTMAAITSLPHDVILSPTARIIVAGIYIQHNMSQNAFALLDDMPLADILDAFDAAQYAQIYLDVNAPAKAEQVLNAARQGNNAPETVEAIDKILTLLAVGQGKADFVKQKLADYKGGESDLWPEAYDFAVHYHHEDVALSIAEQLYKVVPNSANRMQLAEALMFNHRYGEALGHLQTMVEKDPEARVMYFDAIAAWGMQAGGVGGLPESQRAALKKIVNSTIADARMSSDERRDLAYVLEDIGFYDQAETVLVALALDQPFTSPDVENLLGFWEDHPSQLTVTWVSDRARHSSGMDQVAWLAYLNDNEHPQAVISLLQDESDLPPAVIDQYIEALVETKNKAKLEFVLEETIDNETNATRLKKLAGLAEEEDAETAQEKGWRKVYALNSNDNEAAKAIGLLDFDAGRFEEAEPLLKQYVQYSEEDYNVNLAYGEILQQQDRKSEAEPYLKHALQQISDIKEKDEATQIDEAYLLYVTDHITESLSYFRQLLVKHPEDKELRADFAELLTETGRFDEASSLLSQQH